MCFVAFARPPVKPPEGKSHLSTATSSRLRRRVLALVAAVIPLFTSACSSALDVTGSTAQQARLEVIETQVSPARAAALINAFRAHNGLGPIRVNTLLNGMAVRQARAMANANQMSHGVNGGFRNRLSASGYNARTAGENIAAGQKSFASVLAAWQNSPPHRRTLLLRDAREMGIGIAYAPGSRYKTFWALVVAAPF